jgi:uncharacterized membrane protein YhaH (DUF805 family)
MFKFHGTLDRRQFLWAAALRIGLFVASIVGFPFLVRAVASATRCGVDTCGAVGLITAMAFKPLAFMIFVFSFVGVSVRRAGDAGVPGWIGLFVPVLFAFDYGFFLFAGASWAFAFSAGVLRIPAPWHTLLALACIAALCALPSRRDGPGSRNPFGYAGLAAFGLGLVIAATGILTTVLSAPAFMVAAKPVWGVVAPWLSPVMRSVPYLMIALGALLAWIVWRGFGHVAIMPSAPPAEPASSDIPAKTLAALAFILASLGFMAVMDHQHATSGIGFVVSLPTMILPTAVLYFGLLLTATMVVRRRTMTSVALLMLAMSPFAFWAHAYWTTATEQRQEAAEIAAIPTSPAARVPATLVIETEGSFPELSPFWSIRGIERVIIAYKGNSSRRQFDRPPERGPRPEPRNVQVLPDEYLLLKVGRTSRFAQRNQMYGAGGGPLELRLVDAQHDELLGAWYRAFNPRPSLPPMLTVSGWFRPAYAWKPGEYNAHIRDFLARSLDNSGRKLAGRSG